jgi:hypothetical protein
MAGIRLRGLHYMLEEPQQAGVHPASGTATGRRFVCEQAVIGGMELTELDVKSGQLDGAVNDDHC